MRVPGREDTESSRQESRWWCRRRPITPLPPIKKNGLIMPRIIYLLGSFIGKNGLIIGNRFTARYRRKEPTDPSIRSIFFLVSSSPSDRVPNPSITNDRTRNRGGRRRGPGFSSLLVSVCGIAQWRWPAISTENNILR